MAEEANQPKSNAEQKPQKPIKKKLRGFPSTIWKMVAILNESDSFKEEHKEDNFSVLIIATDMRRAALVKAKGGEVEVESVENKPETIKPAKKQADGRIECPLEILLGVVSKKINPVKAILTGKLKIRGIKKVLKLIEYFKAASHIQKERSAAQ